MTLLVRLLFCTLLLAGSCAAALAEPSRKVALVIGNAAYAHAAPLRNPTNDANDVCAALRKLDFEVICKLDVPSKRAFKEAIFEFTGKLNDKTVALFYFAGHGVQLNGLNYLVPVGANAMTRGDIEDESIQINYLMSELEARRAALNIFILDACRDNPFVNPIRGYENTLGMASQLYAPPNSIIAMSTGPGQLSLDGAGRNGTFTKNLLLHLTLPRLPIEEMFKAASGGARADARRHGRQQDPQITTSFSERFCMAGCGDKPEAQAGQLAARTRELDSLQQSITQTRAKQQELEEQKLALQKKQAELDQLQANLEQSRRPGQASSDSVNATLSASAAKLRELDAMKDALLKKQQELTRIQDSLAVQQATTDDKELRTRKLNPPEETRKPITIVPAF